MASVSQACQIAYVCLANPSCSEQFLIHVIHSNKETMFKKFIPAIALATTILMQITIFSVSANDLTPQSESEFDYFIKPIPQSNVVVVEPNYGHFFNPDKTIEKDESGELLYTALDELNENYDIDQTRMVSFERNGQIVPNLYVLINEELAANKLLANKPN